MVDLWTLYGGRMTVLWQPYGGPMAAVWWPPNGQPAKSLRYPPVGCLRCQYEWEVGEGRESRGE